LLSREVQSLFIKEHRKEQRFPSIIDKSFSMTSGRSIDRSIDPSISELAGFEIIGEIELDARAMREQEINLYT